MLFIVQFVLDVQIGFNITNGREASEMVPLSNWAMGKTVVVTICFE